MAQASDSDPVPSSPRRRRSVKRKLLSDIVEQSPSKRTRSQNAPKSPKKNLIENKPSTPNKDKINAKSFYGGAKSKYVTPLERKEQKEKAQHSGLKEIQNQFHFASTSESSDNSSKSNNSKKSTKGTKPKKKVAPKSNSSHILQGKPKVAATNRRSDPPPRKFTLNTPPAKSNIASVLKEESNGESQAETESTNPSPESQVSIGSSGSSTKRFFKHQASPGKKARSSGPQVSLRKGLQLTFHRPNVRSAIEERMQLDDMVSKKGLNPKEDLLPSLSKKKLDKKSKKSNIVSIKIGVEPKRTKKPFENPFSQDLFDDFSSDLAQDISADSFTANLSEEGSSISRGFPSKSDSACHSLSTVNGTPSKLSSRLNSPRKSLLNLTPSKRLGLRSNTGTPTKSQSSVSPDSAKADSVMLISEVSSERSLPSEGLSYKDSPQNSKKVFSIFAKSSPGTKPNCSRGSTPTNSEPGTPESQRSLRGARSASRTSKHMLKSLVDKEGREQMILDFGQRLHGATQCDTCGMTYTEGEPSDETTHAKFHRNVISALKFNGWKKERICMENPDGSRIIVVTSEDKFAVKKVEAVRQIVDSELGFVVERRSLTSSMKTFLYISEDKQVIGCCIAEEIRKGYRMLADSQSNESQESVSGKVWCCSTKPTSAKCGISRIWVFSCARRKRIASQLLDCVRCHFLMGYALRKDELAFSDPTPDGRRLASKYCETPCFLVYKHNDSPLSSQV